MSTRINLLVIFILIINLPSYATNIDKSLYRTPNADNLLYLELDVGLIIIEMNPLFAPKHVAQIKKLVRNDFYNGLTFYRVIDGFVAQAGTSIDEDNGHLDFEIKNKSLQLPIESRIANTVNKPFTLVQSPDMFAAKTGFIEGFTVAKNSEDSLTWLTHCPGVIGMSRNNAPNTATTDFYIVIGQAPRYLDSIMSVFGRVIYGMDNVQRIKRVNAKHNGNFINLSEGTTIKNISVASDLPKDKQLNIVVERTNTTRFRKKLSQRRMRADPFFYEKPPQVLDICQVPVETIIL
ncbi:peptidylprolyl isomerase [Thalassotalea piscium]|uniref:peptidylprolyl isomerase n=1 Tax=Thalassotalea piscium TaxID=1230533 RepID=A0A7X0NHJ6_9GAMM|nr:peptidylprolyl isomerase [Thalassotalea piscium]MBB6543596.1 peptidylprolyl isomerase [Thalassotalea piscium]